MVPKLRNTFSDHYMRTSQDVPRVEAALKQPRSGSFIISTSFSHSPIQLSMSDTSSAVQIPLLSVLSKRSSEDSDCGAVQRANKRNCNMMGTQWLGGFSDLGFLCLRCLLAFGDERLPFLLDCGHSICERCCGSSPTRTCPVDKVQTTTLVPNHRMMRLFDAQVKPQSIAQKFSAMDVICQVCIAVRSHGLSCCSCLLTHLFFV